MFIVFIIRADLFFGRDFAEILMSQLETLKAAGSIEDAELATLQILRTQVIDKLNTAHPD